MGDTLHTGGKSRILERIVCARECVLGFRVSLAESKQRGQSREAHPRGSIWVDR